MAFKQGFLAIVPPYSITNFINKTALDMLNTMGNKCVLIN